MKNLIWFRNDLRIEDNPALQAAAAQASKGIVALYIITPSTWQKHRKSSCQVAWILAHLKALSQTLSEYQIPLWIRQVDTFSEIPNFLTELIKTHAFDALFFNQQYEYDELKRDESVSTSLNTIGCPCFQFEDQTIVPPGKLKTKTGDPFKVFTPFKKAWLSWVEDKKITKAIQINPLKNCIAKSDPIPDRIQGFDNTIDLSPWAVGEIAASKKLEAFCEVSIQNYAKERDYPGLDATSRLSPYFAIGVLSPHQCVRMLMQTLKVNNLSDLCAQEGPSAWLNEIIWREFYRHILYFFPRVSMNQPFQLKTKALNWKKDPLAFKAWCEGNTGIPVVDAAMRCLNQTGWLHNRLRMITAMFLSKNLFQDWRTGEAYFMSRLLDGDLASNNGGWQWSASTGTDAAPYFRVFNPVLQSEKFDPEGEFIRRFCPELSHLDSHAIHLPFERGIQPNEINYPAPIVDLKISRHYAIAQFKAL